MTNMYINFISIEQTASFFLASFTVKRKEEFDSVEVKTYNCIVLTNLQHTELYLFKISLFTKYS